jgi:hypothetical protein
VEIGGASYICPVKSVSLIQMRVLHAAPNFQNAFGHASTSPGPLRTKVNDVQFKQYHLFRAETRILSGDNVEPDANPPDSVVKRP